MKQWISSPCRDEEIGTGMTEFGGRNCVFRPGRKLGTNLENGSFGPGWRLKVSKTASFGAGYTRVAGRGAEAKNFSLLKYYLLHFLKAIN